MSESLFKLSRRPYRPLIKKELCHKCFPVNFAKFLRTSFLYNITGGYLCKCIQGKCCHGLKPVSWLICSIDQLEVFNVIVIDFYVKD